MTFQLMSATSLLFSTVALILSCVAVSIFVGLKNSTHRVQYVPIDPNEKSDPKELDKQLNKEWIEFQEDEI